MPDIFPFVVLRLVDQDIVVAHVMMKDPRFLPGITVRCNSYQPRLRNTSDKVHTGYRVANKQSELLIVLEVGKWEADLFQKNAVVDSW